MTDSHSGYNADHYVTRLDLGADPFDSSYDLEYYFSSETRDQQLEQLVHFSRFSDHLVMLVGASGSGTSTLLDHAMGQLQEVMDCCYLDAEVTLTPEQVMDSLSQQLNLHFDESTESSDFFAKLRSVIQVDDELEPILLIVDQAHFLPLDGFQLLRDIVAECSDMLKLLFVGEYQIEQLAESANFDQEKIMLIELEQLNSEEIDEFLLGLLRSVGYAGEQPFNTDQLAVLYQQSGGNIAELMQLAPALLSSSPDPKTSVFNFGIPLPHLAATGILITALFLAWLLKGPDDPEAIRRVEVPLDTKVLIDSAKEIDDIRQGIVERKQPDSPKKVTPQADLKPKDGISLIKPTEKKEPMLVAEKPVNIKPAPKKLPDLEAKVAKKQEIIEKVDSKPAEEVVINVEKAIVSDPIAQKSKPLHSREQRLMDLAGTDYVLQLMGAVDEQRTERLVKRYAGRLPVTYFETRYKGKPWYVAIVGPYKSKNIADEKLRDLPQELQKLNPWPRSIASIQKDIRAK